jgi:hypothetical protein
MLMHHMWFQGFEFSPVSIKDIQSQDWGPDIEHMFWDEARVLVLLQEHYPEWVSLFNRLPMVILKCDVSRAFILHHYGGGYADIDFKPLPSFTDMVKTIPLTGITVPEYFRKFGRRFPSNNLIFCLPRNPYWIDTYLPHVKSYMTSGGSWLVVWMSMLYPPINVFAWTGPMALYTTCTQLNILDHFTSIHLGENPGFTSNWIQYQLVLRHLILGGVGTLAVLFVFLWVTVKLVKIGIVRN